MMLRAGTLKRDMRQTAAMKLQAREWKTTPRSPREPFPVMTTARWSTCSNKRSVSIWVNPPTSTRCLMPISRATVWMTAISRSMKDPSMEKWAEITKRVLKLNVTCRLRETIGLTSTLIAGTQLGIISLTPGALRTALSLTSIGMQADRRHNFVFLSLQVLAVDKLASESAHKRSETNRVSARFRLQPSHQRDLINKLKELFNPDSLREEKM